MIAAILAAAGFARGYAPGRCAAIISSSDAGARSAVRLERPA
jgi:hypothetical protein